MFGFDKIDISFNLSPFVLIPAVALLAAFSWFVYRYTLPEIPHLRKNILIFIRALALAGILLLLFEPTLFFTMSEKIIPRNFVFIDNSKSITIDDKTDRAGKIKEITDKLLSENFTDQLKLFTFGQEVKPVGDISDSINFTEPVSDFERIFYYVMNSQEPVSSIVIVSDGVITRGENPIFMAEKLGIPVNTIVIGDTSERKDIRISSVLYNDFVFAGNQTPVKVSVENTGFENQSVSLSLFENDSLIYRDTIKLQKAGFQNEIINYKASLPGEQKLTVKIDPLEGESTQANNIRIFYLDVLSSKIKVLLLAGSPSPDVSFISRSVKADTNISFHSIIILSENKILGMEKGSGIVDSADILFMVGFPSAETPQQLIDDVLKRISTGTPYFLLLSRGTDFNRLKLLQNELSFNYNRISNSLLEVQPEISIDKTNNPIMKSESGRVKTSWENLPPVLQPDIEFTPKPGSEVLAKVRINNVAVNRPLILSRRIGNEVSVTVLAGDIWRWKLQTATKENRIFDLFVQNSLQWLNSPADKKRFSISTTAKIYQSGEAVNIKAQVYDEAFNPVNDADVKVTVENQERLTLSLSPAGNGLYEGTFIPDSEGDYTIKGQAFANEELTGTDSVLISVGGYDIELANVRADASFLTLLSNVTGGKNFPADNTDELFGYLNSNQPELPLTVSHTSEFSLWSFKWILAFFILLFSIEWFLRKRWGLL